MDPSARTFRRLAILTPFAICLVISGGFTVWFGTSLSHVLEVSELSKLTENVGLLSDYTQHLTDDMRANAATLSAQVEGQAELSYGQHIAAWQGNAASGAHIKALTLFGDRGSILARSGDMTVGLEKRLSGFVQRLQTEREPIFLPLPGDEGMVRDIPRFVFVTRLHPAGVYVLFEVSAGGRKQRAANLRASNLKSTLAMYDTATDTVITFGGGRVSPSSNAAEEWPLQELKRDDRTRCDGTTVLDRRCIAFRPIEHSTLVIAGLIDRDLLLANWIAANRPFWIFASLVVAGGAASSTLIYLWALRRREDQKSLRAALANVERLYTAKSNFMAHLSHELRTPLNSIMGFSDVMRSALFGPLQRRYRDYASDIHAAASHLHGIASDIMDVERLERGELSLEPGKADLNLVATETVRILAVLADKQGVTIEVTQASPGPATVDLNAHRATQIAINLLSNAVKYSEAGDRIAASVQRTTDHRWSLVVSDEGIGMTAKEIAYSERPFGHPAEHRSGRHDSVGLGLPIVRGLLAATGGRLEIVSEKSKGTTVVAVFGPISDAAPPSIQDATAVHGALRMASDRLAR